MKLFPNDIKKIAIFRALQLGDMLCAVPAMRALRFAYPDAEITLLGLPWAKAFAERFNCYTDRFIHFPGYAGLPEQEYDEQKFTSFFEDMKAENFDLIIQMQGNGTIVNDLLSSFSAKHLAGYYNNQSFIDSELFMLYPEQDNEILRHLKLLKFLGIEPKGEALEFPFFEKDFQDFENLNLFLPEKKYICIHPGSRAKWRQWPIKYFAALADLCIENGYITIITGTINEADITREMIKCMRHTALDLTGATSLGAIGLLIKNAFLLVSNCTGVSHIAAAVKVQSIVISMDGEPERWSPLNKNIHHVFDCKSNNNFKEILSFTKKIL